MRLIRGCLNLVALTVAALAATVATFAALPYGPAWTVALLALAALLLTARAAWRHADDLTHLAPPRDD
ncbi:hypothetical protein SAMN04487819_1325 [Actinopolyspora alba]|uniref:Uncharacterized protein n=1 Tax=Actinopolyspora alba TaxID=673379 RepID=A0A1I2CPF0_9ACTN|nr:hypothetical protein [Actinopolyspora alba]SFE70166.1 hypothetical protein SAMN04487819_1325 [Actinopolyspora alba]